MSELLRPQQRVRQVDEQSGRHNQPDDVVEVMSSRSAGLHCLLEPLARGDVGHGEQEEHDVMTTYSRSSIGRSVFPSARRRRVEREDQPERSADAGSASAPSDARARPRRRSKNPPSRPRESSKRYSSRRMALAQRYGPSVLERRRHRRRWTARAPVQRPALSHGDLRTNRYAPRPARAPNAPAPAPTSTRREGSRTRPRVSVDELVLEGAR